jgi:CAAX prenyl protease-like protein
MSISTPPASAAPDDASAPRAAEPQDAPGTGTMAWVGPFAVFMVWLALDGQLPLEQPLKEVVRDLVILGSIVFFSRRVLAEHARRAPHWMASIALGVAVCALWVGPDLLVPGWRESSIFQNGITGKLKTSIPPEELTPLMLVLRTARAALLVPILEELFWRGWLPRWLQDTRFQRVPLGTFTTFAFWATAALFAAEHGPYWEVGLLCGIIYNWWMQRTRSLGDLILVHATTNLALSLFVIGTGRWTFWM